VVLAGGGGWVFWTILKSRREQPDAGAPRILGATGYVVTELSPRGTVQVAGEEWTAISESRETIPPGQEIRVTQSSGNTLTVVPMSVSPEDRTIAKEP
ncbi:MAG: NfeD family protein, partial [Dehalococcoidia bacterium]|nr:NfeD family protein [Dehalococcoidia bacterium]